MVCLYKDEDVVNTHSQDKERNHLDNDESRGNTQDAVEPQTCSD